jgi:hypothetical protein
MRRVAPLLAVLALAAAPASAQDAPRPRGLEGGENRITLGGSIGFGFGSVTWVGITGEVGYLVTDRIWAGTSGMFQYTDDSRYQPSVSALDYGFGVFGRYFLIGSFFADAEWTYTSYESRTADAGRSGITSVLVGAGYGTPVGGRSSVLVEVLYDVTGNAKGVYGTPWVVRAGFAIGF